MRARATRLYPRVISMNIRKEASIRRRKGREIVLLFFLLVSCLLSLLTSCDGKHGEGFGEAVKGIKDLIRGEDSRPEVVPYLDSRPSAVDGQGIAFVKPDGPFVAGSEADFEIVFTVGEAGVSPGGFVLLQISPWWGWSPPQTHAAGTRGHIELSTSFSDPSLDAVSMPMNRVLVYSRERAMRPGETITFRYGNRARVDRFAEAAELFQIFVDADGDGHSACIQSPPSIRIEAMRPSELAVSSPSIVNPGQAVEVRVAPLDMLGNWSKSPPGTYALMATHNRSKVDPETADAERRVTTEAQGGERVLSFSFTPEEEGIYFFHVEGPSGLRGTSNVMLCQAGTPGLNLYFGDIHGHSRISDGTGTPEDFYRYARDVSGLDIAALTDHSDFGTIPVKGDVWERLKRAANQACVPGRFVTFVGFEWTNWEYGHRNVYYRNGNGPVFRSIDEESDTPEELWKLLENHQAMTVAHHVGGGPVATDWDVVPGPKEWLVEISSIHGTSEVYRGRGCIYNPVKGAFVRDALARGYKLGIIGSGDTHDGHPGRRSVGARVTGTLGVYSRELTREAVWEAFRKRHTFGTSGPKIILNFRVADSPMGSEVMWEASRGPVPLALRAVGCDEIERVEIIRNGERLLTRKGTGPFVQLVAEDPDPPSGTSWYYARILQEDGNLAWSSPVWVTVE